MSKARVLVIEDDPAIHRGIVDALKFDGYTVHSANRGDSGLDLALQMEHDLVLLDLVLPGRDGLDVLGGIRQSRPALPVIILTARGDETDRIRGLRLGADDYIVKPFSVKELLARIEAVLRRCLVRQADHALLKIPSGEVDLSRREVRFSDGGTTELSDKEVDLLRYLARNGDRAISRDELLQNVWCLGPEGINTRTIDMHVARLREKLRDLPQNSRVILTVRGQGYKLALLS